MKKPTATEYQEQKTVIDWWSIYSRMKGLDERLLFAIPNGAHLAGDSRVRAIKMKMLKAEGLRPGCPDLMLALPKIAPIEIIPGVPKHRPYFDLGRPTLFHGLFIEMKRIGGKAEPLQIEYCDLLRRQGYNVVIAQGAEEAIRAIKGYIG